MDEMLGVLCGLTVVLAVVTLVGHGLWVLLASLGRMLQHGGPTSSVPTGPGSSAPQFSGTPCSVCLQTDSVIRGRCVRCGAPQELSDEQRERVDLWAVRRQLQRWEQRGELPVEVREAIARQIQQALRDSAANPEAPSAPVTASGVTPEVTNPFLPLSPVAKAPKETAERLPPADEPPLTAEIVPDAVAVHPLDRVESPSPLAATPSMAATSRRTFAEMMQAFMEQRNIRWVELLSGLLIVGCATGLVISLRAALKDKIPYFPALSFMLVTAAFHAAGIYSLRRWNLKSTSRGVLIIATLLVPLSILAAILLSGEGDQQRPATDPVLLVAMLVGIAGFGTMNYHASRALVRHAWPRAMLGVLGPSFSLLLLNRLPLHGVGPFGAAAAMILPMGTYLASNLWSLLRARQRVHLGTRPTRQFFLELGLSTFALSAALGLFLARSGPVIDALRNLSPLISLAAAALLASGLLAHRRLVRDALAGWRVAGTGLAVLGALVMTFAAAFAWPNLWMLGAVGLVNFVTVTMLAVAGDLALLHTLAVVCLAISYLAGFHLWRGTVDVEHSLRGITLLHALLTGSSATALMLYASVMAAIGRMLLPRRSETGGAYLLAAFFLGGASTAAAIYVGFWAGPEHGGNWSTLLLAYAAVATLTVAWYLRRYQTTITGAILGFLAFLHGLWQNTWLFTHAGGAAWLFLRPWESAAILDSLAMVAVAASATWWVRRQAISDDKQAIESFVVPLSWSSFAVSLLVCVLGLDPRDRHLGVQSLYLLLASTAWLQIAFLRQAAWAWRGFQLMVTGSVVVGALFVATRQPWWSDDWSDARIWHLVIASVAVECLGWVAFDWFCVRRLPQAFITTAAREWTVEQRLLAVLVGVLLVMGGLGTAPGIGAEFGTSELAMHDATTLAQLRFLAPSAAWVWLTVAVAIVAATILRRSLLGLLGMVLVSASVLPLIAVSWTEALGTASALRWLFGLFAVAWCVPACWLGGGGRHLTGWRNDLGVVASPAAILRDTSLVLALMGVTGLTTAVFLRVAAGGHIAGPDPASLFGQLGPAVNYSTPLGLLVAVLLAYAVREGKSAYALTGSLVFQYFISLACLLPRLSAGQSLDDAAWASCLQWNGVGLAFYALAWSAARRWIEPAAGPLRWQSTATSLLAVQVSLLLTLQLAIAVWITLGVCGAPGSVPASVAVLGGWPSYIGVVLTAAVLAWHLWDDRADWLSRLLHFLATVVVTVMAATMGRWDATGAGWGAHGLTAGFAGVSLLASGWLCWRLRAMPLVTQPDNSPAWSTGVFWGVTSASLAVLTGTFQWSALGSQSPELGALVTLFVAMSVLALRSRWQPFAYFSVVAAVLAAWIGRQQLPAGHPFRTELGWFPQIGSAALLAGCWWLVWERWFQRRGAMGLSNSGNGAVHRWVARLMIVVAVLSSGVLSLHLLLNDRVEILRPAEWAAFLVFFATYKALHLGMLWDRRAWFGTLGLYAEVCLVGLFVADILPLSGDGRRAAWVVSVAAPIALSGWAWSWRGTLSHWGTRVGIPDGDQLLHRTETWLVPVNVFLLAWLMLASTALVLGFDGRPARFVSAWMPLVGAAGIAGWSQGRTASRLRLAALLAVAWGVILLGWSDIEPQWSSALFLARAIRLLMAMIVVGFGYGVVGVRLVGLTNLWHAPLRRGTLLLISGSFAALILVLLTEVLTFEPGVGVPVSSAQIAAVSCVLVGLIATLISLAVLPGRDPLALSEKGRMTYVYGAQAVAALLFAHIYLAMPQLFHGTLRPYWPYIVLGIAFAGVGVGTVFERLGWRVLAEPFQRSGSFLPIVPALGMWVIHSESSYTSVLFVIGVLYMLLSFTQRSPVATAAAALAGNGSLWSLLGGHENLSFASHPQFWLIPPAFSVLIAAHINRQRLGEARAAAVRYGAMGVIYLSSTAEMLRIGIGESLWPPLLLIILALMGVGFGIAMRVRAYLYLGSAFVLVGVLTMVAHAAKSTQQLWPWFAFGIALGTSLLVLFGYFERHRTRIMAWLEKLRDWDK